MWDIPTLIPPTLQQGETYQINSSDNTGDVTGTWITSDKPLRVFAGADWLMCPMPTLLLEIHWCRSNCRLNSWGTQALALSFAGRTNGDSYRVLAAYSNTVLTITGKVVTRNIHKCLSSLAGNDQQ